jgi:hypothetical protein
VKYFETNLEETSIFYCTEIKILKNSFHFSKVFGLVSAVQIYWQKDSKVQELNYLN